MHKISTEKNVSKRLIEDRKGDERTALIGWLIDHVG
jgi:hypothetical protein